MQVEFFELVRVKMIFINLIYLKWVHYTLGILVFSVFFSLFYLKVIAFLSGYFVGSLLICDLC